MNIGEALPRNAQQFPQKLALQDRMRSLTFKEFHLRTNRLGNYLLRQGIVPGDIVAFACGNRCENFEILFALAKIGAIAAPFDYHWSALESEEMVKFFSPKAFVLEDRKETGDLGNIIHDHVVPGRVVGIDARESNMSFPYEEALSSSSAEDPPIDVKGSDIFLIMITSGTTGFPKGCIVNHDTYVLRSINQAITKGVNRDERALLTLPLQFNAGRGAMMGVLYLGGTVFIHEKFDEEGFLRTIEQERISYTSLVPTLCDRLLRYKQLGHYNTSTLQYVGITGGHLSQEVADAMIRKVSPHIYEAYASTDCGLVTVLTPEDRETHGDTVGRPIWCVMLRIMDDDGNEVPLGKEGEICVRSPLGIQGYFRNDQATEELFQGGWCHSGDIGFLDAEGYLHTSGRKKNMIKSGGISIFPEEIEGVLLEHPQVEEVAVVGINSQEWGEAVKALVVLKEGAACEPETVIRFCKERMARYKAPKLVEFVAKLPRTGLGKIDRGRLNRKD